MIIKHSWNHRCTLDVRDYELDAQGIVNNGVYANYLEHARHLYLQELDIDVIDYHQQGFDLVVIRMEQDFKASLRSRDQIEILSRIELEGRLRVIFHQEIRRIQDNTIAMVAKITATCVNTKTGKPCMPEHLKTIFEHEKS